MAVGSHQVMLVKNIVNTKRHFVSAADENGRKRHLGSFLLGLVLVFVLRLRE